MHEKYKIVTPISRVPVIHPAIFYDDGNCTFNYAATGTGEDWMAQYDALAPHSCLYGIRLGTRVTGPQVGDEVILRKYLWLPPTKLITLDLLFANERTATNFIFYVTLHWYDGTNRNAATLRFHSTGGVVARWIGGVNWTQIDSMVFNTAQEHWNHLQLSANLDALSFHYLTVNHQVADLRAVTLPTTLDAAAPFLELYLAVETLAAEHARVFIDHILLMPANP